MMEEEQISAVSSTSDERWIDSDDDLIMRKLEVVFQRVLQTAVCPHLQSWNTTSQQRITTFSKGGAVPSPKPDWVILTDGASPSHPDQ